MRALVVIPCVFVLDYDNAHPTSSHSKRVGKSCTLEQIEVRWMWVYGRPTTLPLATPHTVTRPRRATSSNASCKKVLNAIPGACVVHLASCGHATKEVVPSSGFAMFDRMLTAGVFLKPNLKNVGFAL